MTSLSNCQARPSGAGAATSIGNEGCRSGSAFWKAPASASSGIDSSRRGAAGLERAPTPCSPPTALKTPVGTTFMTEVLAAQQPPEQKMGCTRRSRVAMGES